MLKKIKLQDAVGTKLAHDITEIRPGEFKGPAFRKGHTVCNEDLCHLQKFGKNICMRLTWTRTKFMKIRRRLYCKGPGR